MISFLNMVCVNVYKICEGKFGGSNRSSSSEKVNDRLMPARGFLSVNKFSGDNIFFQESSSFSEFKISCAPNLP